MLPPLKPLPMKDRISMVFLRYGQVDVRDGALVLIDKQGERMHIPVGSIACIMLEPGTRVSHPAYVEGWGSGYLRCAPELMLETSRNECVK